MKTLYTGGPILSLNSAGTAQALLVEDGRIRAVGPLDDVAPLAQNAKKVSLEGRTLLPAFVDGHSHITALAQTLGLCQLSGCGSLEEIGQRMRAFRELWDIPAGAWVIGFGYDQNDLKEGCHPTKRELDAFLPDCPAMVTHASGHMGVVNSLGLQQLGITKDTPQPEGGKIGKWEDGTPSGYLEETAFTSMGSRIPRDPEENLKNLQRAQQVYFSHGITTIHEGLCRQPEWDLLSSAAGKGLLQGDVAAYVDIRDSAALLEEHRDFLGQYHSRLKIAGYKLFLDGSPQGRTAWVEEPYLGEEPGYRGYPTYQDGQVLAFLEKAQREGVQIAVHCNGDAAAEQLLRCYEQAFARYGREIRPLMIHAQLLRPDQVPRLKPLGMVASFFVAHVFHWGDVHVQNFGRERASQISPTRTALEQGVVFDFHQDSPVIPPNMVETMWCAVCRRTKSGQVLGENQRLPVGEALRAMTANAAFALFEEQTKGTLSPGKRADLVLLNRNPLTCPPEELRNIQVVETIKDGETVYRTP